MTEGGMILGVRSFNMQHEIMDMSIISSYFPPTLEHCSFQLVIFFVHLQKFAHLLKLAPTPPDNLKNGDPTLT
jgi:hypothetical protein